MESTAQIARHPIHPMLIPYPFALLTTAAAFDVASTVTRRPAHARTGAHLAAVGIGSALVAAIPGIVDYFGTVPRATPARRTATLHAICNLSALTCFAAAHARRRQDGRLPGASQLVLEIAGTGLLSLGGWLGGNMVYHHHIGIVEDEAGEPALTSRPTAPAEPRRAPAAAASRVPETV